MKKLLLAAALSLGGSALAAGPLLVNGAGSTFDFPLFSKWFSDYHKRHGDLQFNYQSIGSGGGIQQFTAGTVDFGATDAPLTDAQTAKVPDVVHVPVTLGAVVVTFNVEGVKSLRLTPETLSGIYLGTISKWNDAALAKENPGVKLPDEDIVVAHRSDGSGTTSIFTDYLSKVSPEWSSKVGHATSVKWPAGLGGKGNEGVTGLVKQNPGAIGYVELAYAHENKLPVAELRNKDGAFVKPTIATTSAAAAGVEMPDDFKVSITNASGKEAWPIAGFSWIIVHKDAKDAAKGAALVQFLWWAIHEGQKSSASLQYAPLPAPVVKKLEAKLKTLTVQGKAVSLASR